MIHVSFRIVRYSQHSIRIRAMGVYAIFGSGNEFKRNFLSFQIKIKLNWIGGNTKYMIFHQFSSLSHFVHLRWSSQKKKKAKEIIILVNTKFNEEISVLLAKKILSNINYPLLRCLFCSAVFCICGCLFDIGCQRAD